MTLTALVCALVALVPAVPRPKPKPKPKHELKIERLERTVETLEYELESVTRELANERRLSTHWIGEASRISRTARVEREHFEALLQRERALPQHNAQQAQAFGFCNCVPSRTQMFDAMIGQVDHMVEQLNHLRR